MAIFYGVESLQYTNTCNKIIVTFPGDKVATKIQEHFLVPIHSIVSEEEVETLLKKLNAPKSKIPVILKGDPAIKKLKPNTGDLIKIERNSHTAGKTIYFRVVK